MIDVSDGLAADLSHIADRSGVGFELARYPRRPRCHTGGGARRRRRLRAGFHNASLRPGLARLCLN